MKIEPSLFDDIDDEVEAAADARAESDVAAGRLISHEAVSLWLASWAQGAPAPKPKPGD